MNNVPIMGRKIVYLSGPMTGYENYNFPEFERVGRKLQKLREDWFVLNPVLFDDGPDLSWTDNLIRDVNVMNSFKIEMVILMKGWEKSSGVKVELFDFIDILKGTDVFEYEDDGDDFKLTPVKVRFDMVIEK